MTGMNRSTVIECVKKLTALKLVSPLWRYKEDGSHASNQYNFHAPGKPGGSTKQRTGNLVTLAEDQATEMLKRVDALEQAEDVQRVFHNLGETNTSVSLLATAFAG